MMVRYNGVINPSSNVLAIRTTADAAIDLIPYGVAGSDPIGPEDHRHRSQKNDHVLLERIALDIGDMVPQAVLEGGAMAAGSLPQAGNSRPDAGDGGSSRWMRGQLVRHVGTRADQAHITGQNIP